MALDLDAQGFGFEAAPLHLGQTFSPASRPCPDLHSAARSQLAVEGEEARIKALKSNCRRQGRSFLAEDFFQRRLLSASSGFLPPRPARQQPISSVFFGRKPSDDKVNSVLIVAAEKSCPLQA